MTEKINDDRLNRWFSEEIRARIEDPNYKPDRAKDNGIVVPIKILGLSQDLSHREVLEKVLRSNAVPGLKRHADNALRRLEKGVVLDEPTDEGNEEKLEAK